MNSEFSRIYLQIIFDKKHLCTKQYIGKQFWEIHNSIFVFRFSWKGGESQFENSSIKEYEMSKKPTNMPRKSKWENLCDDVFNESSKQPTTKKGTMGWNIFWRTILVFISRKFSSIFLSQLHESFVNILRYCDCNSNENWAVHVIQQPIQYPSFIQFRIIFNQDENSEYLKD